MTDSDHRDIAIARDQNRQLLRRDGLAARGLEDLAWISELACNVRDPAPPTRTPRPAEFDPDVIRAAAKVAAKLVKCEYYNFSDYVKTMAQTFGRARTMSIAPLLEHVWGKLHSMDKTGKISPAGSTAAVLGQDQQPNQR